MKNDREQLLVLRDALLAVRDALSASTQMAAAILARVHETQHASALNLLHYLALRQRDLRPLQAELASLGLSSLGRSESHVSGTLTALLNLLDRILAVPPSSALHASLTHAQGETLLREHTETLLGPAPSQRSVRVMVTLPSEAADDPKLARELVRGGMNCARINAAHDDPAVWLRMVGHVRAAARELDRACLVALDLAGPKCRTGALQAGPQLLKLRPTRDARGQVLQPARAFLTSDPEGCDRSPVLPISSALFSSLRAGDGLRIDDTRGRKRHFRVVKLEARWAEVHCEKTSYVERGARVRGPRAEGVVGALPALEVPLLLHVGETLELTRAALPGAPSQFAETGAPKAPAHIACEPPELIDMVRTGEPLWLDDGRIGAEITTVARDAIQVRITAARPQGEKLRSGKGINLPASNLTLAPITRDDERALKFAAAHADLLSLSFVHDPGHVHAMLDRLDAASRSDMGIILKIETRAAFERLPELLLAGLRSPRCGVMIARGDLAVECGFERLAELQEEILSLCAAAHVPVVWATQVLESLAQSGRPTRAEVTDAAMGARAECVMLNKGPYIGEAVRALDDILTRMHDHQDKKSAMFRPLRVAQLFHERLGSTKKARRSPGERPAPT